MATTANIVYVKDSNGTYQSLTSNASGHLLTYDSNNDALLTQIFNKTPDDLSARTNITDSATSKVLKCDSNGNLSVGIAENPTVHLRGNDGDNGAGSNRMVKCSAKGELHTYVTNNDLTYNTSISLLTANGATFYKRCNNQGHLMVNDPTAENYRVVRGAIGGFTSGTGSQWSANGFSTKIDMEYHKTIEFHIQGSMSSGHTIYVCVSNDDSTYVRHQALSTHSVGGADVFKGSFTSGFRYVKFENGGADISTTTYKQYSLYN